MSYRNLPSLSSWLWLHVRSLPAAYIMVQICQVQTHAVDMGESLGAQPQTLCLLQAVHMQVLHVYLGNQPLSNGTASYQRAHLHIVSALACHAQSGCSTRTSGTVAEEGCTPA